MTLKANRNFVLIFMIYFLTKMFWDKFTYDISEYCSLLFILYGLLNYFFLKKLKKKDIEFLGVFCLYAIYVILNGFIVTDSQHMLRGVYEYIFYVLIFFAMVPYIKRLRYEDFNFIFRILGFVGLIMAFLTFIEFFKGTSFLTVLDSYAEGSWVTGYGYTFRPKVFSRSYLSHGLVMGIFSLFELHNYAVTKNKKWILIYLLCLTAVIFTSSRGPLVATLVASVFYYFNSPFAKRLTKKQIISFSLLFVIAIILIYLILFSDWKPSNNIVQYFLTRIRNIFNWTSDGGNVGRILRWEGYWNYYCNHNIWLGNGAATAGSSGLNTIMGSAESGVFKRLIELGIIGFVLYYFFSLSIICTSMKTRIKNVSIDNIKLISISIILCILIDDITLQITEEIMIAYILWFFMSVLYVNARKTESW